jgi:rhodanese-related sulfurtransferase
MTSTRVSFIAAALLGVAVAFPAFVAAQNYPASVKELVASTRKQVKTVDLAGFKTAFDAKTPQVIVDVREPEEFAAGYVPRAVNVPRGLLEFNIWGEVGYPDKLDMNKKIYLYCKTGGRCTLAAKTLQDLGFKDVTAVVMLFEDWRKAGYPVAMPPK